jgi:uncharacterized membrane protein
MLRESLKKHYIGMNKEFRFRGEEPGRLENFSDAIFALAITLLLISTSPPGNFNQIKRFLYDLLPFALCMTLLIMIWAEHNTFFLRYGLRNSKIIFLNTLFLMIVLFYVYPLKFLTRLIEIPMAMITGDQALLDELTSTISNKDMGDLMIVYGLGAASVFFVLMWMYRYALSVADELELNEIERFDTRAKITSNLLMGLVPLFSVVLALIFRGSWLAGIVSGFAYFLYTPVMLIYGNTVEKRRKKLLTPETETSLIPEQ